MADALMVSRRHPEWKAHQVRWRWLLDSLEGGNAYRQAVYGTDSRGLPVRNLVRHKREYPDPREQQASDGSVYPAGSARSVENLMGMSSATLGVDQSAFATDDDYELRRARTPVPTFVREAIETHLGKIYDREVERESPSEALTLWWSDVDAKGTSVDEFMVDTVAPVFLALGQVDLLFDHPRAPDGAEIRTMADQRQHGLDRCVASLVLPENVVWWTLDARGRYAEALVREFPDDAPDDSTCTYRLWTAAQSTLYDAKGKPVGQPIPHRFGVCPLVRAFDRRKVRCRNVGQSRYEGIAERQREYYNRDSELILSDTTQAHPLLQGPEDFIQADGSIPIGPSWLLPKKKNTSGTSSSYEGFDVVDFPKDGAESLRKNKSDIRDDVDRDAGLTKPAGAAGSTRGTVSQSGVSKRLDSVDGNARLASIAKSLARVERAMAEMALTVLLDRPDVAAEMESVKVVYPTTFDLDSVEEITAGTQAFQALLEQAGKAPETEGALLCKLVRLLLPGRSDEAYEEFEDEIESAIEASAERLKQASEAGMALMQSGADMQDQQQPGDAQPDPTDDATDAESQDPAEMDA